ncbi:NAD(P)/FAD-dependent oxidoreductase [Staphylococcus gallinarum]|uniref:NAD(P)/FAD-dependent oxidoreductase n=1 Tax=Staphylococcus gallinarum TaxID=1293 RepID=UPI001E3F2D1C|nr:FAD-dependent oxidoreductase [Staphylococcus gallinarum]MCD8919968.1 FAD-binding oxidoreductase [Staphylococcus gallinarum]UEH00254.1 FAD-binding oxidoreductase [Staphylococcus gallinarum]
MNSFDVIVIGAGIIGSSVSYYLTKAGYSVALIDKGDIANGTSSRCDAVALICDKKPGIDTDIGYRSIQLYKELAQSFSFDFQFSTRGSLYVCETEQELEIAKDYVAQQVKAGYQMKTVNKEELPDIEKHLAKDLAGGVWTEVDSTMNPYMVCYAFIEEAKKQGLKLITHEEVKAINQSPLGAVESVQTTTQTIYTKKVVNCAGVWASKLGDLVGIDIPIKPRKGLILVTERTSKIVNQKVHEFGYMLSKFEDINYKRKVSQLVEKNNIAFTIEPTEASNYLVGGHRDFSGYGTDTNHEVMKGIAERANRFLPILKNVNCIRAYAGVRPWVVDHLPIVSEVDEVPGYFIASGHEGDGISMAPITGKMMTELISRQDTEFNIDRLKFSRYKNKKIENL